MGGVVSAVGNIALGNPFGASSGLLNSALGPGSDTSTLPSEARANSLANQAQQLQDQQAGNAQTFTNNLPQYQDQLARMSEDQGRAQLASQMANQAAQANSRGLLYSGLKKGADYSAMSNYASQQSANRAKINQETEAQARQMQNQALDTGFRNLGLRQQQAQSAFEEAAAQNKSRSGMFSSLFSGIGKGLIGA